MPKLKLDADQIRKLAQGGSSNREIAAYLDCDEQTIRRRFRKEIQKGRAERKIMIRQAQNKLAMGGNATMLIWLGKNELDQSENPVSLGNTEPDVDPAMG